MRARAEGHSGVQQRGPKLFAIRWGGEKSSRSGVGVTKGKAAFNSVGGKNFQFQGSKQQEDCTEGG